MKTGPGGYIVAAPSLLFLGEHYEWGDGEEQVVPSSVETLVLGESKPTLAELLANPPVNGNRDDWSTKVCGHFAAKYRDDEEAYESACLAQGWAKVTDRTGYAEAQFRKVMASIWKAEHQNKEVRRLDDERPRVATFEAPRLQAIKAWEILQTDNDPPQLFRSGGLPVRLEEDDTGRPKLASLTHARMTNEVARAALWFNVVKDVEREVEPLSDAVTEMLATKNIPLPILHRIVAAPVFGPNGELQSTPGYHPASRTLYVPADGFEVELPPEDPSAIDLAQAADYINELIDEFPFESNADRAHAVALLLLPFVRDLIDGPTPLHLFNKPSPGTGASLLSEVLLIPSLGTPPSGTMAGCNNEDEWRKRLTSLLSEGPTATVFDNLTGKLDSPSLCAAITAPVWTDRILGGSSTGTWPVRTTWVATANNLQVSTDIARRTVQVQLDAKLDRPWEGRTFRKELPTWAYRNRAELVWSALCVGRAWLRAGILDGKARLGSFDNWAKVVGGLLDVLGVEGFLENTSELYEQADSDRTGNLWLVERWWKEHQDREVKVAGLFALTADPDFPISLGPGNEQAQRHAFGRHLSLIKGRVFPLEDGTLVSIARGGQSGGSYRWRLVGGGSTPELALVASATTDSPRDSPRRVPDSPGALPSGRAGRTTPRPWRATHTPPYSPLSLRTHSPRRGVRRGVPSRTLPWHDTCSGLGRSGTRGVWGSLPPSPERRSSRATEHTGTASGTDGGRTHSPALPRGHRLGRPTKPFRPKTRRMYK